MVKSISWPTPLTIGIGQAWIARATTSSLNAHRSSSEPPPRALRARRHDVLTSHRLRLAGAARDALARAGGRLALAATSLHAFSPLRTLERGYAIVKDAGTGRVIRSGRELEPGQEITGTLGEGGFDAVVSRTR